MTHAPRSIKLLTLTCQQTGPRHGMAGTQLIWAFWYSVLFPTLFSSPVYTSSLHAVLGIDWDALKNRASHGDYWLTTSFVPEVLSPVLVRIASVFKDIIRKQWYLEATIIGVVTILLMMLLSLLLACIYRRHLRCQIQKVPTLVRNLDQRDYIGGGCHCPSTLINCAPINVYE